MQENIGEKTMLNGRRFDVTEPVGYCLQNVLSFFFFLISKLRKKIVLLFEKVIQKEYLKISL